MKKPIAILLLLTSSLVLMSQQESISFVSLKSGVSFPIGSYDDKSLDNGCFTTTGVNFSAEGAWFFLPWLGVGGQFSFVYHPVDVSSLGWEKVQNDPFLDDVTIRSDPYRMMTASLGAYGRWDAFGNFSLNGKVLLGMMWARSPYQLYKPTYFLVAPKWYEITSAKDRNAAITAGAGLQYDVSRCVGLKLDAEYTYSKMVFAFYSASNLRYEYRDISFINLSLGVVFNL